MKKLILAAALALISIPAMAQTNSVTVQADPHGLNRSSWFGGANIGSNLDANSRIAGGFNAGYQFNPYFRAEGTFDYMWRVNQSNSTALMVNAIGQYRIPNTLFTPYVLVGTGLGFGSLANTYGYADSLYDVGAGVRLAVSKSVELDLRYRYIGHFASDGIMNTNALTIGLDYRF